MLLPLFIISLFGLKEMKCPEKICLSTWASLRKLFVKTDQTARHIRRILVIDFLLNFFYAVMVVYMPLYLKNQIGLTWNEIGLTFTVMLLPFVLFELPLGKLADRFFGEKEILIGGLIIISLATIACSYLFSPIWFLWAILLFVTRMGAASIEIMKETYLFKKISGTDAGIVSLSRINVPFSYIVGPIFVAPILATFGLRYVFLGLGLVMLLGLIFVFRLKDTK
jgi:MFS family permease